MVKHLFLLVVLNVAAHHDNSLPHQEHEKAAQQGQYQYGNTGKRHYFTHTPCTIIDGINKFLHQHIILCSALVRLVAGQLQFALYIINNKARNLRRQHAEVIGNKNKENTNAEAQPVFAEIFIEGFQMLQMESLCKGIAGVTRFSLEDFDMKF